jgi:hypothetical protein
MRTETVIMTMPTDIKLAGLGIDAAPLVRSMGRVTNSYKHLFLRALLGRLRAGDAEPLFRDLFHGMLAEAWWPAFHYRLTLGRQDRVVAWLEALVENPDALRLRPEDVLDYLRHVPFDLRAERGQGLLRYVPERLLSPWFPDIPQTHLDRDLARASGAGFDTVRPLYRIEADRIVVHPDWVAALTEHAPIFDGWSDAIWLGFLETRNPHATSLLAKIRPAFERGTLTEERRIWGAALELDRVRCVYTAAPVAPDLFAVDHVLPHAFVGHDRFWNLSPIAPALNATKSDRLPPEPAIARLADQHAALWRDVGRLGAHGDRLRRWRDDYGMDLGLDPMTAGQGVFRAAYAEAYDPLLGIARRMGFPDWDADRT